jgi:Dual specificity phosphatase, catalytic domain
MGISRSATVVAAYLIYRHGLSPAQAIEWMKLQRPIVNPNFGFQEQLQDYYSVLQMDHPSSVPDSFGWSHLSMCSAFTIDPDQEVRKGLKRQRVESVREAWKAKQVEWVKCVTVGWQEDIERILQRHISHISLSL